MKFDKETLIAAVVCLVVLIAAPYVVNLFSDKPAPAPETTGKTTEVAAAPAPEKADAAKNGKVAKPIAALVDKAKNIVGSAPAPAPAPAPVVKRLDNIVLNNGDLAIEIDPNLNAVVKVTYLKHFKNKSEEPVVNAYSENSGLFCIFSEIDKWQDIQTLPPVVTKNSCTVTQIIGSHKDKDQGKLHITQTFTLADKGYTFDCKYHIEIPGAKKEANLLLLNIYGGETRPWSLLSGDKQRGVNIRVNWRSMLDDNDGVDGTDDDEDFMIPKAPDVRWAAVSNKYFSTILQRTDSGDGFSIVNRRDKLEGKNDYVIKTGAVIKSFTVKPGQKNLLSFSVYDGPKKSDALTDFAPGGAGVIHMAWGPINYLARFLLWVLGLFYKLCGSWGFSIILLTILVRSVFYPLTARGNESMKKMQRIQPKFKELKEKYKDNPQLLNQKMTELYRQEGVNPLAGCLPILLQIPIFFALYAMLDNAIDLRNVSFLWCKNLAAPDTIFSIPIYKWSLPVNPLVLAMTALMVIQQRMTPMSMDSAQKKMMALMPIIMLFFLYDLPSGLTLYWTVSNLFSILQLQLQKKRGEKTAAAAENQGNK